MRNRITLTLTPEEAAALDTMARRGHRYPKQQLLYILYLAAVDAGLMQPYEVSAPAPAPAQEAQP